MIPIIGDLISSTIGNIVNGGIDIIKKMVVDKDKQAEAEFALRTIGLQAEQELRKQEHDEKMAQSAINMEEAKSTNIFVAGWRPSIGWICSAALFWNFIGYDVAQFIIVVSKSAIVAPKLAGSENLLELVFAMLGLSGFRTYEKVRRIQ